jgi:hypothetical protein
MSLPTSLESLPSLADENAIASLLCTYMRKLVISKPQSRLHSTTELENVSRVILPCSTNSLISRLRHVSEDMRLFPPSALVATEPAVSQSQADAGAMRSQQHSSSSPLHLQLYELKTASESGGNTQSALSSPLSRGYIGGGGGGGGYNSDTSVGSYHSSPGRSHINTRKGGGSGSKGLGSVSTTTASSKWNTNSTNPLELRIITSGGTPPNLSRGCTPVANVVFDPGEGEQLGAGHSEQSPVIYGGRSTPTMTLIGQSTNVSSSSSSSSPQTFHNSPLSTNILSVNPILSLPPTRNTSGTGSSSSSNSSSNGNGGVGEGRAFYRVTGSNNSGSGGLRPTLSQSENTASMSTLSSIATTTTSASPPLPPSSHLYSTSSNAASQTSSPIPLVATTSASSVPTVSPLLLRVRRLSESYTASPETLPASAINAIRRARALARSPSGGFLHNNGTGGSSTVHQTSPGMMLSGAVSAAPSPDTSLNGGNASTIANSDVAVGTLSLRVPRSSPSSNPTPRRMQTSSSSSSLLDWGVGRKSHRASGDESPLHPLLFIPMTKNRLETPRGYSQLHGEGMGHNRLLPSTLHTSSSLRRGGVVARRTRALSASAAVDELHTRHLERTNTNINIGSNSSRLESKVTRSEAIVAVNGSNTTHTNTSLSGRARRQGNNSLIGADLLKLRSTTWATRDLKNDSKDSKSIGQNNSQGGSHFFNSKANRVGAFALESSGASSSAASSEDEEGVFTHASSVSRQYSPSISPSGGGMLTIRVERKHSSLSGRLHHPNRPSLSGNIPINMPNVSSALGGSSSAGGSGDRSSPSSTLSVYAVNRVRAESEAEKEEPKDVAFAHDSESHNIHLTNKLKLRDVSRALSSGSINSDHSHTSTTTTRASVTTSSILHSPATLSVHARRSSGSGINNNTFDNLYSVSSLPLSPITPPSSSNAYSSPVISLSSSSSSMTGRRTPVVPSPLRKATMSGNTNILSTTTIGTTMAVPDQGQQGQTSHTIVVTSSEAGPIVSSLSSTLPDTSVLESALLAGITTTTISSTSTTMTTSATTMTTTSVPTTTTSTSSTTTTTEASILTWSTVQTLLNQLCPTSDAFMNASKKLWTNLAESQGEVYDKDNKVYLSSEKIEEFAIQLAKQVVLHRA